MATSLCGSISKPFPISHSRVENFLEKIMEKSYRFPPSRNSEGVGAVLSLVTLSDANFNTL